MVEIIIILGNRTPNIMRKRVLKALEHFKETPSQVYSELTGTVEIIKYLLFSGGSNDGISEPKGAIMMYDYALKQGVEKKYCILEKVSRNTVENLWFSKNIIEEINKTLDYKPQITICTSTFHMKRTVVLAKLIFNEYQLKFVHTQEQVSDEDYTREMQILNNILDSYWQQQVANPLSRAL